ncbi:hypothetical protein IAU59_007366 [Kwoniella sp. CBS 9459]
MTTILTYPLLPHTCTGVIYAIRTVYKPPIVFNLDGGIDLEDLRNITPTPQHEITPYTYGLPPTPLEPTEPAPSVTIPPAASQGYDVSTATYPPTTTTLTASPGTVTSTSEAPVTPPPIVLPPSESPPATIPFPTPKIRQFPPSPELALSVKAPSLEQTPATDISNAGLFTGREGVSHTAAAHTPKDRSISTTPTEMYGPPRSSSATQASRATATTHTPGSDLAPATNPAQSSVFSRKYTYSSDFDRTLHEAFPEIHPYEPRSSSVDPLPGSVETSGSPSDIKRSPALKPMAKHKEPEPVPPPKYQAPKAKGNRDANAKPRQGDLQLVTPLEQNSSEDLAPPIAPFTQSPDPKRKTSEGSAIGSGDRPATPPGPAKRPLPLTPSPPQPSKAHLPATPPVPPFANSGPLTPPSPAYSETVIDTPRSSGFRPLPAIPSKRPSETGDSQISSGRFMPIINMPIINTPIINTGWNGVWNTVWSTVWSTVWNTAWNILTGSGNSGQHVVSDNIGTPPTVPATSEAVSPEAISEVPSPEGADHSQGTSDVSPHLVDTITPDRSPSPSVASVESDYGPTSDDDARAMYHREMLDQQEENRLRRREKASNYLYAKSKVNEAEIARKGLQLLARKR